MCYLFGIEKEGVLPVGEHEFEELTKQPYVRRRKTMIRHVCCGENACTSSDIMALTCLLATVTQAQASSVGVDSDPMALSWFHVIVSFVVTGNLLFCGWIATMKQGQEELLPGMGDEEDRETNDYNSEKSSESRVNQGGRPEGDLEGHLHRAVQEGEDCVQGQQLQEVPDGEERVELPEMLVSESEQVDVYFDVQQKTSRRIMLIVTMLIKGYKKVATLNTKRRVF